MTNTEISLVEVAGDSSNQSADVDREKLNVNSPRSATKNTNMFGAPANLITQVNQNDVERQKEMAKKLGRRENEQKKGEEKNVSSDSSPTMSRSSTRGISGWLCCGPCKRKDQQFVDSADDSSGLNHDSKINPDSDDNDRAGEAKIVDVVTADNEEDVKEEQYSIEISETDDALLGPPDSSDQGRKCLVLDLDETLVHSSFTPVHCSFSIPIMLDGNEYKVFVLKRPFVDEFIEECAKHYELVVFTASLSEYANPVIDTLDKKRLIKHRLFRESCVFHQNQMYVKDLSRLGRNIKDCIIIDNSPFSYLFDPTNAIGCTSWFGDQSDTELRDLLPVLRGPLLGVNDVRTMLDARSQTCEDLITEYANTE